MKRAIFVLALLLFSTEIKAQDYTLTPVDMNPKGTPKSALLGIMDVTNNSSHRIDLKVKRIVKDIPTNWISCFCYPICVAPWIDTLNFSLTANATKQVAPNFTTDEVPDSGTVVVLIWQVGYESEVDTMVYIGSTAFGEIGTQPQFDITTSTDHAGNLTINGKIEYPVTLSIYDMQGRLITRQTSNSKTFNTSALPIGNYLLHIRDAKGAEHSNKFVVSH